MESYIYLAPTIKLNTSVCIDLSGSTTFKENLSHDNKTFSEIYCEALQKLYKELDITNVQNIGWSDNAKILVGEDNVKTICCIENLIELAEEIEGMSGGTFPEKLIPLLENKIGIIVTDGCINVSSLEYIKQNIDNLGPIYLVIIPHIDSHKELYSGPKDEFLNDYRTNVNISIPQAFSQKLGSVFIYNYNYKTFDRINELTAPWSNVELKDIQNMNCPNFSSTHIPIMSNGNTYTCDLVNLLKCDINVFNEEFIDYMITLNLKDSIRQNATQKQKDDWNNLIKHIYVYHFNIMFDSLVLDKPIITETDFAKFNQFIQTKKKKQSVEQIFCQKLGKKIQSLYVDKTVGEMTTIGSAKVVQTQLNVSQFKTMNIENKLACISPSLIKDVCSICMEETNVFSILSIPCDLIKELTTCTYNISVGKKGAIKKMINVNKMREVLEANRPFYHYTKLCSECANHAEQMLKHNSDPEYGITKLIPQNTKENGEISSRLVLYPLIDPQYMNTTCNPNTDILSFARQWFRGIIANFVGIEPASQECLLCCLMFLTCISNESNALTIYANQLSLIRGGANDKYGATIGRLFELNNAPINKENLIIISIVQEVIEKANIPINDQNIKLLLLCLIEKRFIMTKNINNIKNIICAKLDKLIINIITNKHVEEQDVIDFGINLEMLQKYNNISDIKTDPHYTECCLNYMKVKYNMKIFNFDDCVKNLSEAITINDIAYNLGIDITYLTNIVKKLAYSDSQFINITKDFINALITSSNTIQTIVSFI